MSSCTVIFLPVTADKPLPGIDVVSEHPNPFHLLSRDSHQHPQNQCLNSRSTGGQANGSSWLLGAVLD